MPILELYSVRNSMVPNKSGLNWCFANAHVKTADAYIALRKTFFHDNPNFFPKHGSVINVEWDDGKQMYCLLEGTQEINGTIFPKQISSYNCKSDMGYYLRNRLGVSSTKIITMIDLSTYGRNYISISKTSTNTYYFDFHV